MKKVKKKELNLDIRLSEVDSPTNITHFHRSFHSLPLTIAHSQASLIERSQRIAQRQ